jgi:hypothetical protein
MHGTYLNDFELPRKSSMVIDDGDFVVFGAEVRRGPETFPACKFQVNYKFEPYKYVYHSIFPPILKPSANSPYHRAANTFTFPDSSDVEDEEGYDDFSEDGMGEHEQTSSEDGASAEPPSAKVSAMTDPIDLTGDESPLVFPSNRIDLTGENGLEQGLMDMMEGRPADIPNDADPVSIALYAGSNPILVDSEDEDAHFSIDSDDQSEVVEDDVSSESDSQDEAEDSEPSEEEDEAGESEMEDIQDPSAFEPEGMSPINSSVRFALATHDNSTVRLSDIRTRLEESSDLVEDDDQSDFGLSEAGEAGIRALFEDGLLRSSYDDPYSNSSEATNEAGMANVLATQMPKHITFASTPSMQTNQDNNSGTSVCQSTNDYPSFEALQSTIRRELKLSDPIARQLSPSDVAMAKSRMLASARAGIRDLGELGKPAEQTLGEKTGKEDFFEARAFNKTKFSASNQAGQPSGMALTGAPIFAGNLLSNQPPQATATTNPFAPRQKEHSFGAAQSSKPSPSLAFTFGEFSYPAHQASSAVNKLAPADIICKSTIHRLQDSLLTNLDFPTREQCSFLDNPAHGPALDRAPSPEPYMTSAVNFNAATHKPRSGLGINDIINKASTTTQNLKRKADDISDATDAELRMWAQSSTTSNDDTKDSADVAASDVQLEITAARTEVVPPLSEAPAPRPTKKLKKLMENVGYAALGGVAVGAGLFSVLVATAPDFL